MSFTVSATTARPPPPPAPSTSRPRPQGRLLLPRHTLVSHGFDLLLSPNSETRSQRASSYFTVSTSNLDGLLLNASPLASLHASPPHINQASLPLSPLDSSASAQSILPLAEEPVSRRHRADSAARTDASPPLRRPLTARDQAPRSSPFVFASRSSTLNFSVCDIPVDFVLPMGILSASTESFWGLPSPPQSEGSRRRRRRRTTRPDQTPPSPEKDENMPHTPTAVDIA